MSALTLELLQQVTSQILEEAAFVFVELADPPPRFKAEVLEGRITFAGPRTAGELIFASSPDFGDGLAANLLGLEPGDPEAATKGVDAVGEMLNIIGGALLAELCGGGEPYQLGLPRVTAVDPATHAVRLAGSTFAVSFTTDEGHRVDAAAVLDAAV